MGKPAAKRKTSLLAVPGCLLAGLVVILGACEPMLDPGTEAAVIAAEIRVGDAATLPETHVGASPVSAEELRQAAREVGPDLLRRWREFWRPKASELSFNLDRQLELVSRPDGVSIDPVYDLGGRLATVTHPAGQVSYAYNPTTGRLTTIAAPDATITYAYDGALLSGTSWSGAVAGAVTRTYDSDLRVTAIKLNGATVATYGYDADSLVTQAGALALMRDAQSGLPTGAALGLITDSLTLNAFGEPTSYQATAGGSPLLSISYTRDELGRIATKAETIEGVATTFGYAYDLAGRLVEVTKDGAPHAQYTYDANGNRLSHTSTSGTVTGTYDAQDRLTQYGTTSYTYNAHGTLEAKTTAAGTTIYGYDSFGNLRSVLLPDNTLIEYLIDGANRRVARKVNGVIMQRWLYADRLRPIAELDGSGDTVSIFVYALGSNSPAYMVKSGVTYRLIKDHLGSPRLVVDAATGVVAQRISFDEYGNVVLDTNPGFQPFGFAGGLYDPLTKLVRFGARDYDAEIGRWTVKDPIRFRGRHPNLYAYCGHDPVNCTDPSGLIFGASLGETIEQIFTVGPFDALMGGYLANQARSVTRQLSLPDPNRGPADAFRHCFWSCMMTNRLGADTAKKIGDIHEKWGDKDPMDYYNNERGRECASRPGGCLDECLGALDWGELVIYDDENRLVPSRRAPRNPFAGSTPNYNKPWTPPLPSIPMHGTWF